MPPKCETCGQHYRNGNPCKCNRTPPHTPPPLQPGDEVWVRAVVYGIRGECVHLRIRQSTNIEPEAYVVVSASEIRRIEGEVKP